MFLKTIYSLVDSLAPFALSGEFCTRYDSYDNSGILLDCGGETDKVLFSLDCSSEAVKRAKKTGAKCIVTHHPAIFQPVRSLKDGDPVLECAKNGISVISAHLNLDCAEGGIDDCLMHGLGGTKAEKVMQPLSSGGYGKVFTVDKTPLSEYAEQVKKEFHTQKLLVYGNRPVHKIASFCGSGMDEGSVNFAFASGADTFVSSDAKHHLIARAVELGLNVILLTHYAAENYGFVRFYESMKKLLKAASCEYLCDERFL